MRSRTPRPHRRRIFAATTLVVAGLAAGTLAAISGSAGASEIPRQARQAAPSI